MASKRGMETLRNIRKRHGRCYELAWKAVLEEPASARLRLVHGWCTAPLPGRKHYQPAMIYGHAWVLLPNGTVYDVVKNVYFSAHDYAVKYRAIVGRVYTRKQAAKACLRHKHLGPWFTDDERLLHIVAGLPTGIMSKGKLPQRWW